MEHDHNIGAGGERLAITGLLVSAITVVAVVNECPNAEAFGQSGGSIDARIIHQDLDVDFIRKFANGLHTNKSTYLGQEHLAYCPALTLLVLGKSLRQICIPELTTDYRRRHFQSGSGQNLSPAEAAAANASLRSTGLWFACQ